MEQRRSRSRALLGQQAEQPAAGCVSRVAGARKRDAIDQLSEPQPPYVSQASSLAGSRLCRLFAEDPHSSRSRRHPHRSIALVGNAPLDPAARPAIAAADFIVRFNWMHHRLPGERVHLWVVAHHPGSPQRWGGFDDLDAEELTEVLTRRPTLLFLGGPPQDVQLALDRHNTSLAGSTRVLHAPTEGYLRAFASAFRRLKSTPEERHPTSGFTLAMLAAACTPAGTQLSAAGYNWSPRQAQRHPMWSEHAVMKAMQDRGWLALRFSPCAALRSCGRLDEHWCRARDATCDFPQVAQADMLKVVRQRPNLRRLLQLMYADTGGSSPRDSGNSGSGSNKNIGSNENSSSEAGSSDGSSRPGSRGTDGSGDSVGGSTAAVAAWRAAAGRPTPQEGQNQGAVTAVAAPLAQAASDPLCAALAGVGRFGSPPATIAIVGNGPLSVDQRTAIATADRVVRINMLNSWLPGERLDVWVARHAGRPPAAFYGFDIEDAPMHADEVAAAAEAAEHVVLWGGNDTSVQSLLRHYPDLPADKLVHVTAEAFLTHYDTLYRGVVDVPANVTTRLAVSPTTGFAVILAALACLPAEVRLHLYGFNWSPLHWARHDAAAEARVIAGLAAVGVVTVHPTPCAGLRACVRKLDVNCRAARPGCWVAPTVYLRTAVHALVAQLRARGLAPVQQSLGGDEDRQAQAAARQDAAAHPDALPHLCRVLQTANASRITIVGSTALSGAERATVQAADTVLCFNGADMSLLPQRRGMVWVVSFQPKSANATSGGYDGLDFQQPRDVQGSLNASEAIIFWGGLHHNIKEAMDRHGLALERKPEVARVVMDDVAPALRLLQGLLAPPTPADVLAEQSNTSSAPFGVLLAALGCSPQARVQLVGFAGEAQTPLMSHAEHAMLSKLVEHGMVQSLSPATPQEQH